MFYNIYNSVHKTTQVLTCFVIINRKLIIQKDEDRRINVILTLQRDEKGRYPTLSDEYPSCAGILHPIVPLVP